MNTNEVLIIRELLAAEDDFVSGSQLADLVGVSRVSIWSHMEKMRAQGFEFEAVRSKGYRLIRTPTTLNETLIQARLSNAASNLRVAVVEEIDSTNSDAERRLAHGEETPFLVVASKQTSGRGRLGRAWYSEQNGNIYTSFAFRPQISPGKMSLFTLWMGVNVCECINSLCRISCGLKWPNDLHIEDRKVAGILTEARMEVDLVRDVVLGIGLNVNSEMNDLPADLTQIATSLRQVTGQEQDLNRFIATVAGRVMMAYRSFINDDYRDDLKRKWQSFDLLSGKSVTLLQGEGRISGVARGIDPSGSLLIEREDGTRFHARAGEVSIEKS